MLTETNTKSIPEQLVEIYFTQEPWHKKRMNYDAALFYHQTLYDKGNIQTYEHEGTVLGYIESWRVNFEQFGRITCGEPFCADGENIGSGRICYIANIWIHPDWRRSHIYKILRHMLFKRNFSCDYFSGKRILRETRDMPKVYKKTEMINRVLREGD